METIYQNLWDVAKVGLCRRFITINTFTERKKNLKQLNFTPQGTRKRGANEASS